MSTVPKLGPQALFLIALAGFAVLLGGMTVFGRNGTLSLGELRRHEQALRGQAFQLIRENAELWDRIKKIGNDDHYLETLARTKLGFVRSNEIVYRFPDREPDERE